MNNDTFTGYNLSPCLVKSIKKMGFKVATPVQQKTIRPFMEALDLIVQAPTGTGKTCAFGIPVSESIDTSKRYAQALILSPTRELAIQTAKVFKALTQFENNMRIAVLYGGENIEKQFAALRRNPHIIIATPGRLLDHINRRTVKLGQIKTVVLDEADRMLDMGFRQDMDNILKVVPAERQTVLFSATMSKEILSITKSYQRDAKHITVAQETRTVSSVKQFYAKVDNGAKKGKLIDLLRSNNFASSLVFVNTKRMADNLCLQLKKQGFLVGALHGDMAQRKRDAVMKDYRNGGIEILVATDVASRGIDVSNIDVVINYDLPNDSDSYIHRIGRTGRAGHEGLAYTLIYNQEMGKLRSVIKETKATINPVLTTA